MVLRGSVLTQQCSAARKAIVIVQCCCVIICVGILAIVAAFVSDASEVGKLIASTVGMMPASNVSASPGTSAQPPPQPDFLAAGEWQKGEWKSAHPDWRWLEIGSVERCLQEHSFMFLGDSHIRMIFHDIGFILLYGSTHKLPPIGELLAHGQSLTPSEIASFEKQGAFVGVETSMQNPCGYYDFRSLSIRNQTVAIYSFVPGSCCLGRRGVSWLSNISQSLRTTPRTILYGSTSVWDYARFSSTQDGLCKRADDTMESFIRHGALDAVRTLRQYAQSLPATPSLLYRSAWAPDYDIDGKKNMNQLLQQVENVIVREHLSQSQWMNFSNLFTEFGRYPFWAADPHGHPLPKVVRSITMVLLNTLCPRS